MPIDDRLFCQECGNVFHFSRKNGVLERTCLSCETKDIPKPEEIPQVRINFTNKMSGEKMATIETVVVRDREELRIPQEKNNWDIKYDPF